EPLLLPVPDSSDRADSDALIAARAVDLLATEAHRTSVLLVRGASIARLRELRSVYEAAGHDLVLLHNRLHDAQQRAIVDRLTRGELRSVGVVGMLGEGFDLP